MNLEDCAIAARRAQADAADAGEVFGEDWAAIMEAYALMALSRNAEAEEIAARVYARTRVRRDHFCSAWARGVEIYTAMTVGDMPRAVAASREVLELAAAAGDFFTLGSHTSDAAHAIAVSGDLEEALRLIEPVVESLDPTRASDAVGWMVPFGLVHLWLGQLEEALGWFEKGIAPLADPGRNWTDGRCLPGLVGTLRRLGRTSEGLEWAERGGRLLAEIGAPVELADLLDEHARLLAEVPARARELHLQALVLRREGGVRLGYADSFDALAQLSYATGDQRQAIRLCAAADAARSVMHYPRRPVDLVPHDEMVAALQEASGNESFQAWWAEGASADIDVLVATLTRGRGPRTHPAGLLDALTPTERDVAQLAGEGLTNPEIAARLYMSRSTVKAHLARVFTKLGVPNRTALATRIKQELDKS